MPSVIPHEWVQVGNGRSLKIPTRLEHYSPSGAIFRELHRLRLLRSPAYLHFLADSLPLLSLHLSMTIPDVTMTRACLHIPSRHAEEAGASPADGSTAAPFE